MNHPFLIRVLALVAALSLSLSALPSAAQSPSDHLKCFKVKDQKTFKHAAAEITAVQTQFNLSEACKVVGKAKLFCVPATKTVISIEDGSDNPFPGQHLEFDQTCYKIKCPAAEIAPELVSDQFGSRTLEKFKAAFLCTPAVKGSPPTTSTTTSTTSTTLSICTEDVKLCADGSTVGRDPANNCEFFPCPTTCATHADCRVYNDFCVESGCACLGASINEPDPPCPGGTVICLVNPCELDTYIPVCNAGVCEAQVQQ